MCLILFSWKQHKDFQLVLAANRDEFYERPTSKAAFWEEKPDILAGRDLVAGGTWIGVTKNGRIAALTNYRDPENIDKNAASRGALTTDFLDGDESPEAYLNNIKNSDVKYNGFNLIVGVGEQLLHYNNVNHEIKEVQPGTYGVSNGFFQENWPKLKSGRTALEGKVKEEAIQPQDLLEILGNRSIASDQDLPKTGVSLEWERALSSLFIETEGYGTRCSTLIYQGYDGQFEFIEKTYAVANQKEATESYSFKVS